MRGLAFFQTKNRGCKKLHFVAKSCKKLQLSKKYIINIKNNLDGNY
jgi:hypothetical protein